MKFESHEWPEIVNGGCLLINKLWQNFGWKESLLRNWELQKYVAGPKLQQTPTHNIDYNYFSLVIWSYVYSILDVIF